MLRFPHPRRAISIENRTTQRRFELVVRVFGGGQREKPGPLIGPGTDRKIPATGAVGTFGLTNGFSKSWRIPIRPEC